MPLDPSARTPVMCITMDGLALGHSEQVARLCEAGARWIQLRMKHAPRDAWLSEALQSVRICRRHGAVLIVNDDVDIAMLSGADGVHVGSLDMAWHEARRRLEPGMMLGGTVNNAADADRAAAAGCLDYVGVGPLRFTGTKANLAPVLGLDGVGDLLRRLGGLPAWVIGGVEAPDLPSLYGIGAAGAAVSSALFRGGQVEDNFRSFQAAWPATSAAHLA
jgi:thiamine-phosphate pyrophosphorylase